MTTIIVVGGIIFSLMVSKVERFSFPIYIILEGVPVAFALWGTYEGPGIDGQA